MESYIYNTQCCTYGINVRSVVTFPCRIMSSLRSVLGVYKYKRTDNITHSSVACTYRPFIYAPVFMPLQPKDISIDFSPLLVYIRYCYTVQCSPSLQCSLFRVQQTRVLSPQHTALARTSVVCVLAIWSSRRHTIEEILPLEQNELPLIVVRFI